MHPLNFHVTLECLRYVSAYMSCPHVYIHVHVHVCVCACLYVRQLEHVHSLMHLQRLLWRILIIPFWYMFIICTGYKEVSLK